MEQPAIHVTTERLGLLAQSSSQAQWPIRQLPHSAMTSSGYFMKAITTTSSILKFPRSLLVFRADDIAIYCVPALELSLHCT